MNIKKIQPFRLWLPLLLQTGLILAMPIQKFYLYQTGRTVLLQSSPVDPYEPMRGYSQSLSYNISDPVRLKKLPGGEYLEHSTNFYIVLQAQSGQTAWQPVRLSLTKPQGLAHNQVILKGEYKNHRIKYGLETFYMPEEQVTKIQKYPSYLVELRVDHNGQALPVAIWLENHRYSF